MGFDANAGGISALVGRLGAISYYQELFTLAFGDSTVTEARIQRALANFERAMVSTGGRWDTAYTSGFSATAANRGLNISLPGFSAQEERGHQLFMNGPVAGGAGCAGCHVPPTFALAANSQSHGLDAGETRVFKPSSLKNIAPLQSCMHDGRLTSLADVIYFYDSGVQAGPALDNRLIGRNGLPRRLNLSPPDKPALEAFLRSLNDTAFLTDPKFTQPFSLGFRLVQSQKATATARLMLQEAPVELVVARGDPAEVLEPAQHGLDPPAILVAALVILDRAFAVAAVGDHPLHAHSFADQQVSALHVGVLPESGRGGEPPQDVDKRVDLCRPAARRDANGIGSRAPFAPPAERCALM